MKFFNKLPLKIRFGLLIFIALTAFSGIVVPFIFSLKNKYNYYSLERKGLSYSQNLLELIAALIEKDKKQAATLVRKIRMLNYKIGSLLKIKEDWKKIEVKIEEYLAQENPSSQQLLEIISQITQLDSIIFENSGAIADPDKAAINILIAHYISFPPLLYSYIKKCPVCSHFVLTYLDNYRYAIAFKKELKSLLKGKEDFKNLDILSALDLDRKGLSWAWKYTFKRERLYKLFFITTLVIFLFGEVIIIGLVVSLIKSIYKGTKTVHLLAEKLENADFSPLNESLEEFQDECGKALNKMAQAIYSQGEMLNKIKEFAEALSKGKFEVIEIGEFKGIWKETFQALNKTVYNMRIVVRRIKSMVIALKLGVPKRVDERGLEGAWLEILAPLNSVAQALEEINSEISLTLQNISQGIFEVKISGSQNLKGVYKEILDNLKKLVTRFQEVIEEIQQISETILEGNLDIQIETSKFKGEYQNLMIMLKKIIEKMKEQMDEIKRMWEEEEELLLFKQTIEEDQEIETVYFRIKELLKNKFNIKKFTFYEVNSSQNFIYKRISLPEEAQFCNQEILVNPDLCRCKKIGQPVWGEDDRWGKVCPMFTGEEKKYICYPFMFEEGVKFILQIVCDDEKEYIAAKEKVDEIKQYIESIIPILQLKSLTLSYERRK